MITRDQERRMVAMVRRLLINREEAAGGVGYRYFHTMRVYNTAKALLGSDEVRGRKVDRDAVLVAALFHDIGRTAYKTIDPEMPGHDRKSAEFIRKNLGGIVGADLANRAADLMDDYDDYGKLYLEKDILVSADILDKFGALNIWRSFVYGAYKKLNAKDRMDYYQRHEERQWEKELLRVFRIKIARKLAERRLKVTKDFIRELQREYDGKDVLSIVKGGRSRPARRRVRGKL
jgi:putative nucleotidyltransferase with HDIG domain